jgi:cytochrome c biogenesis protein CcmG/thiol:disulfide interchange protein DsbE
MRAWPVVFAVVAGCMPQTAPVGSAPLPPVAPAPSPNENLDAPAVEVAQANQSNVVESPSWIGIYVNHMTTSRVLSVATASPADLAGIQPGDDLVSIDGRAITTGRAADEVMFALPIGHPVTVVVRRGTAEQSFTVVPGNLGAPNPLVGKPAPRVVLGDIDGASISLASLTGHVVVLVFFATWCPPCADLAPKLGEVQRKYVDARVVGVSDEDLAVIRAYGAAHQLGYSMVSDTRDVAAAAFWIPALPTVVVIDKQGVVQLVSNVDIDGVDAAVAELVR